MNLDTAVWVVIGVAFVLELSTIAAIVIIINTVEYHASRIIRSTIVDRDIILTTLSNESKATRKETQEIKTRLSASRKRENVIKKEITA